MVLPGNTERKSTLITVFRFISTQCVFCNFLFQDKVKLQGLTPPFTCTVASTQKMLSLISYLGIPATTQSCPEMYSRRASLQNFCNSQFKTEINSINLPFNFSPDYQIQQLTHHLEECFSPPGWIRPLLEKAPAQKPTSSVKWTAQRFKRLYWMNH